MMGNMLMWLLLNECLLRNTHTTRPDPTRAASQSVRQLTNESTEHDAHMQTLKTIHIHPHWGVKILCLCANIHFQRSFC